MNPLRPIISMVFFAGMIALIIGYVNQLKKCPPPKVEYRYVPRTFQEEQDNPARVTEIYQTMFHEPTPWIRDFSYSRRPGHKGIGQGASTDAINKYYISGV